MHPIVREYFKAACAKAGRSKSKKKIKACLKNLQKAWDASRKIKRERDNDKN